MTDASFGILETNNDYVGNKDSIHDKISETENGRVDLPHEEDSSNVHSDTNINIKDINSQNINRESNIEHNDGTVQKNVEGSKTTSDNEQQNLKQEDSVQEQKQGQNEIVSELNTGTLDIETVRDNVINEMKTQSNDEEQHTEIGSKEPTSGSNLPNADAMELEEFQQNNGESATEHVSSGNENTDVHEKSEGERSEQIYHEVTIESENVYSTDVEDTQFHENEQPKKTDEDGEINYKTEQTYPKQHADDPNGKTSGKSIEKLTDHIGVSDKGLDSYINLDYTKPLENLLDILENHISEEQMFSSKIGEANDDEADKKFEGLDSNIQDRLSEVVKEFHKSEIIEENSEQNFKQEQLVEGTKGGDENMEKQGGIGLENDKKEEEDDGRKQGDISYKFESEVAEDNVKVKDFEEKEGDISSEIVEDDRTQEDIEKEKDDTILEFEPRVADDITTEEGIERKENDGGVKEARNNLDRQESISSEQDAGDNAKLKRAIIEGESIDFEVVDGTKFEPESSNTPGTRFIEETIDNMVAKEGGDSSSQEESSSKKESSSESSIEDSPNETPLMQDEEGMSTRELNTESPVPSSDEAQPTPAQEESRTTSGSESSMKSSASSSDGTGSPPQEESQVTSGSGSSTEGSVPLSDDTQPPPTQQEESKATVASESSTETQEQSKTGILKYFLLID